MKEEFWKWEKEGKTDFLIYQDAERIYDSSVFYNPKMVVNRDLTLLTLLSISEVDSRPKSFLDPFAGTGIRSFRIIKELPENVVKEVIATDKNPLAIEIMKRNIAERIYDQKLQVKKIDAYEIINSFRKKQKNILVIDIDPFGSPIEFLNVSLESLKKNEGYLFVTATDLQVLCGKYRDTCIRLYNAIPTRNFLCHEVALRILISNILISAGRLGLAIEPLLSYHFEHFLRVKVKVSVSRSKANIQHKKLGFVLFCTNCSYYTIEKLEDSKKKENCPSCFQELQKAGPLWLGELYSGEIIKIMLSKLQNIELPSKKKTEKLLCKIEEELKLPPFFYYIPYILRNLNLKGVSINDILTILHDKGFLASRTYFNPQGIKTNARFEELLQIIKSLKKGEQNN
ncbi:MAG: tRNA (guanine(10)-N(2))-dimethyltransferase [Candidatus Heimdallarchaeaceae archaeon]